MRADLDPQRTDGGEQLCLHLRRQILVWKVDQGFLPRQRQTQPARPIAIQIAKRAIQLPQRLAPLRVRFGGDQIEHRLRRDKVQLAVQEGAACELPRFGGTQARGRQGARDGANDSWAGVQMKLGGILARIGSGTRQPQHHGPVQQVSIRAAKGPDHGAARGWQPPAQRGQRGGAVRPADPQYRDRGTARARGEREDRVRRAAAHPASRTTGRLSTTDKGAPVAARTRSTVNPGAIWRMRNPVPAGSNKP